MIDFFIGLSIPIAICIVIWLAIIWFATRKKPTSTTNATSVVTPNATNNAATPVPPPKKKWGFWKTFLLIALLVVLIGAQIIGAFYNPKHHKESPKNTPPPKTLVRVVDSTEVYNRTTPCDVTLYLTQDSTFLYSSGPVYIEYRGINGMEKIPYSGNGKLENLPPRKSGKIRVISTSLQQRDVVVKRIHVTYR
jgi:hypothetical protein